MGVYGRRRKLPWEVAKNCFSNRYLPSNRDLMEEVDGSVHGPSVDNREKCVSNKHFPPHLSPFLNREAMAGWLARRHQHNDPGAHPRTTRHRRSGLDCCPPSAAAIPLGGRYETPIIASSAVLRSACHRALSGVLSGVRHNHRLPVSAHPYRNDATRIWPVI